MSSLLMDISKAKSMLLTNKNSVLYVPEFNRKGLISVSTLLTL